MKAGTVVFAVVAMIALFASGPGCGKKADTPEAESAWQETQKMLDAGRPGAAGKALENFIRVWKRYRVSDQAEKKLEEIKSGLDGAVNAALEKARGDAYEEGRAVLEDAAAVFPETEAGQRARIEIEFNLPMMRAKRLMIDQKYEESKAILQDLLKKNPKGIRAHEINAMLNGLALSSRAMERADEAGLQSIAQSMRIAIEQRIVENGSPPDSFTTKDLDGLRPGLSKKIEVVSYSAQGGDYKLVIQSKTGSGGKAEITRGEVKPAT